MGNPNDGNNKPVEKQKTESQLKIEEFNSIKSNLSFHQKNYLEERLERDKIEKGGSSPAAMLDYAKAAQAMDDREANYAAAKHAVSNDYLIAKKEGLSNPVVKSEYLRVQENELNNLAANGSPEQLEAYNQILDEAKRKKISLTEVEKEQLAHNLSSSNKEDATLVASAAVNHFQAGGSKDKVLLAAVNAAANNDVSGSFYVENGVDGKIKTSYTIDAVTPPAENYASNTQTAPSTNSNTEPAVATNTVTSPTGLQATDFGSVDVNDLVAAANRVAGDVSISNNTAGVKVNSPEVGITR